MQADRVGVAASRRARASTSRLRRRTMRPRRSPDPWRHHPLERVWCSIRSGLLLRWTELRISRLRVLGPGPPILLTARATPLANKSVAAITAARRITLRIPNSFALLLHVYPQSSHDT